jgi:predicted deacetylase
MSATYLVRIDDICPTMNWSIWPAIETILVRNGVKPLLAVIPDNHDHFLNSCAAEKDFWNQVRTWRNRGWSIGLHGYQHRYVTRDSGIMGINRSSEFAGLPQGVQAEKLHAALAIFAREGVGPDAWIAPAHSFDFVTLELLRKNGLRRISDGFFLYPNLDSRGMLWIPQQLWRFRVMPFGVWTVCLHINSWGSQELRRFALDIETYRSRISSFDEVVARYSHRRRDYRDILVQATYPPFLRTRLALRSWVRVANRSSTRDAARAAQTDLLS